MCMICVVAPGEWNETLVVTPVGPEEATELAKIATSWLVEQGTIEAGQWRNMLEPIGHAAGPKARSAHGEASEQTQYGFVEIWASGEGTKGEGIIVMGKSGPIMMRCPKCGVRQGFHKVVLDAWEANAEAAPQCNACRQEEDFDRWDGEGDFACARLTITFNHWPPIKDSFKQELKRVLGRQIRTVVARL